MTATAPVLLGDPRNQGVMRRRIILDATEAGRVRAGVEDDFHHFEVEVFHAEGVVTDVVGRAPRHPFDTCPGAASQLKTFIGYAVGPSILLRRDLPDPLTHCTHMYELAYLAVAQAGRGGRRIYEVEVPDRAGRTRFATVGPDGVVARPAGGANGTTTARAWRDGDLVLSWNIDGEQIASPEGYAGHTIWTVMKYAAQSLDEDGYEAARVLRRGVHVAGGRIFAFQDSPNAHLHPDAAGSCHVFQAVRSHLSTRVIDAARDFTALPDLPLASFDR